ncbi:MAG TPA: sigma 54-interacting transcriptional regulator [Thermodesulfobacteriota bacterium]|nr:sigma 54-interacting transcriptional regulator [Thermodesulfobacteriota bacterium]
MIPDGQRQLLHLTIGRLLQSGANLEESDQKLFDIVHHLNLGSILITDESERLTLARLNLSAGRKAKSSTAHEASLNYLKAGIGLLEQKAWESDYDLAFDLDFEAAECQYLCGNFEAAEQGLEVLLQRAASKLDKARVYRLRGVQFENMGRYADALVVARESLTQFGVSFPDSDEEKEAALESEIESISSLLDERSIGSLIDLPVMTHRETRMVMNILTDLWSRAYIVGDSVLARLVSATMVRLSLIRGNVEESAYGYVTHAITVGPVRGDYKSAYEFGRLALKVNERFNDSGRRAKIYQQFHAHVNLWRQPMQTCIPYAREACRSGLESGDFLYAAYGACTETWPAFLTTNDLEQFVRDYSPNIALIKKLKVFSFVDALKIMLNWARALRGKTKAPLSLSGENFDEDEYCHAYRGNPFFTAFYAVAKLNLCYVFGEYGNALEAARLARGFVYQLSGTIWPVMYDFWNGLTLAANYAAATEDERRVYLQEMEKARKLFAVLAENCPENYLCQKLMLSAEIERVTGHQLEAFELYERAIVYARETNVLQHRALANELCARFWLERGQEKVASVFMVEARACYAQWGAMSKVGDLEEKYPHLLSQSRLERGEGGSDLQTTLSTIRAGSETLDLMTVIKSSQVISGEIVFRQLIEKLMRIVIENAGAEKGVLLLEKEGDLIIQAESSSEKKEVTVLQSIRVGQTVQSPLPQTILNYVKRTCESVVLADAINDPQFAKDPYIVQKRPKSVLCAPILLQGKFIGILYLENSLTTDAFTQDRVEVVRILSSQAAISLENARLYDEMKREISHRKEAERALQKALIDVEQLKDRLQIENIYLQEEIKTEYNFEEIIGQSESLKKVLRKVEQVAPTDATVLIYGETGTGKELIARAIHNLSPRKDRPLVKVNCGAISAGLVESELFGHEKGAFTGALQQRIGRFELADGGTIFLDEVGELPPDTQVKLLRVLQEGEFERVGSSKPIKVDVRVIAATNHNLVEAVKSGSFRSDLFYRLNVFPIEVPSLRERKTDIPLLANFFITKYARKLNKEIQGISKETLDRLMNYHWPGNIRELQNIIERAVVLSPGSGVQIHESLLGLGIGSQASGTATLDAVERAHILRVLEQTNWLIQGKGGAASILGINPNTLRSRMQKLGIKKPKRALNIE